MSFLLTAIGTLLLLASLAGTAFGVYMAADSRTREAGKLFAIWWVPAAAAASGVLMRDVVTFVVGTLCLLVAGTAFVLQSGAWRQLSAKRMRQDRGSSGQTKQGKAVS